MVPADDQAIALPCASVIVIIVLLNVALTCATPEAIFLRSRLRTRASLPIINPFTDRHRKPAPSLSPAQAAKLTAATRIISSCRQSPLPDPYGCERWCGCAGRGPAIHDDDAARDSSRDPSAA